MIKQSTEFNNKQLAQIGQTHMHKGFAKGQQDDIGRMLRKLGAVRYDFWLPETHVLPYILHPDEELKGIVYGHYQQNGSEPAEGRGALVATDRRILLIDKKPLFLKCDELRYAVISGVTYARVGPAGTVTLHTRAGDIHVRTLNNTCALLFVKAIEAQCFDANAIVPDPIASKLLLPIVT